MKTELLSERLQKIINSVAHPRTTAAGFEAAAEDARGVARTIDELETEAPTRRAEILAAVFPTIDRGGSPIAATLAALDGLSADIRERIALREIATFLAARFDHQARSAKKAEAERDEQRKPFEAQTRRAHEVAAALAEAPKLFDRAYSAFKADIVIANLGDSAWSRAPRARGSAFAYELNWRGITERLIATGEALSSARLPGKDFAALARPFNQDSDNDKTFGVDVERALGELRKLIARHDRREIVISEETIIRVVAQAQSALVAEYGAVCGALRALVALDGEITEADRTATYPDGQLIFDLALFPKDWVLGRMTKQVGRFSRINLPTLGAMPMAAE